MKMGICGVGGRMGRAILNSMINSSHELVAAFDREGSTYYGKSGQNIIDHPNANCLIGAISSEKLSEADVIIDFSSPAATLELLKHALPSNTPVVIGTTGFSQEEMHELEKASQVIPLLLSPNMSLGVNLLFKLTEIASQALSVDYDPEVVEAHHRLKKDSPSGTAVKLIDVIRENLSGLNNPQIVHGREGLVGERSKNEIGVHSMRGGSVIGDHTVSFIGMDDVIELTHRAGSRDIFAQGAVRAAEFIAGKEPGFYSMYDVLGLS